MKSIYKMKLFLVILSFVSFVTAELKEEPTAENYHENYGIAAAARIKASESSQNANGSRIAGGSSSRLGQFPYMGGLLIDVPQGTSLCGSSLISNTRAVTAAHCWHDGRTQARQLTIVLGSMTLFTGGTRISTNQVVVHPKWDARTISNDVAVIRISWVSFNDNIKPIALASGSNTFADNMAIAVGFGRTGDNVNIESNQSLSHVSLQVISNDVCGRSYREVRGSTICTSGANGRGPCPGDSGGPLVTDNKLIGIVSFAAASGCTRGHPGGYARVTSFNNWIRRQ